VAVWCVCVVCLCVWCVYVRGVCVCVVCICECVCMCVVFVFGVCVCMCVWVCLCVVFLIYSLSMLHYKVVLLNASILRFRGCSDQHVHAFPLHFYLHYYFVLGSLYIYIYINSKTYSMVRFYIYFTLLWIPLVS